MKAERDSATVSTYRYGPAGLRDQVNIGAAQTRTVWDNGFAFLTQDQSGRTLTRTEHTGDKALYLNGESGKEILLRDGLDSVTGTVAPGSGTLQSKTDYDAWGNSVRTGATQSKHGYTGHLDDTETGLIYARARYYDSEMGRFINRDPLEGVLDSPVTWNAYLYANANPSKFTDPSGMSGSEFDWLSVGADFAGTTMMPAEMGAGRDPQMWLEPLFNDWGKGSLTESIDYAAEGCEGFLGCYSLAFMKTFYHASTWGFASHHDTVLSAYNKRLIDQQTYRTHGIGGGALIVTYNVALARLGGMKAFAGKGGGFKSAAGFGGAMGYGSDAISQWFLMDAGIQENFNYNQNAISGFLGMTGGGISHGLGKGFGNLTNGRQKSSELKVDEGNTSINHELDITLEKPAYSTSTLVSKGNTVISSVGNANIPSVQQLSKAAASANRNGLTDAGRSLQKHSGRPNSVYSSTDKKSTTLNREAQSIVDDILNDPKTQFNTRTVMEDKQKITVIEATASDGRVLRFNDNGTRFIGFREPTP